MENHNFQWVNPLLMAIFNSKLSGYQSANQHPGGILADEMGLGKTAQAGDLVQWSWPGRNVAFLRGNLWAGWFPAVYHWIRQLDDQKNWQWALSHMITIVSRKLDEIGWCWSALWHCCWFATWGYRNGDFTLTRKSQTESAHDMVLQVL